jgi:anti-anti-sigma factor
MDTAKLSLEFTNDLAELENLSRHVENFCEANGLAKKNVFELNLVIDEVFTNIVSYAFNDNKKHRIKIEIRIINRELMVRIEDDGAPFDPTTAAKADMCCPIEDRKIGGVGLHLINRIMSSVFYKRKKDKNILVLKKCLRNNRKEPLMEILEEQHNEIMVFKIKGRLDSKTSPEFEEKIVESSKGGGKNMIFDFKDLEYISSAGLRVILKTTKEMKRTNGQLVLCCMQDYVKEVFEIAGFDTFLSIKETFDDALKKF